MVLGRSTKNGFTTLVFGLEELNNENHLLAGIPQSGRSCDHNQNQMSSPVYQANLVFEVQKLTAD